MKLRHALMGVTLVIFFWLALFGDKTSSYDIAEPAERKPVATIPAQPATSLAGLVNAMTAPALPVEMEPLILVLEPRETLIGGAHAEVPSKGLFTSHNWMPPPPPPPPPSKPLPPPPPTAPPLPFTYFGKKMDAGLWEVYLARGDQTLIVRENTVVDGIYRIDAIKPPLLSLTYLPLNQIQTLTIGEPD